MSAQSTHIAACRECGKPDEATYSGKTQLRMLRDQLCFNCVYWLEIIESAKSSGVVVAGGHYYVVRPFVTKRLPGQTLGYGGSIFIFRTKDGKTIRSNDVWNGSAIPERFRKRLPDNAVRLDDDGNVMKARA